MQRNAKPHVSDAIRQLRSWVTIACTVLALCCAVQMLVYAFAAYTDARWDDVHTPRPADKTLRVVGATNNESAGAPTPSSNEPTGGVRTNMAESSKPAPLMRVKSIDDARMKRSSDFACAVGVIASVTLAMLTMLGVAVAGGGSVPGVERATTACVWSIVLGLLCLPWQRIMPGLGMPGIFGAYADMTGAIESKMLGGASAGGIALAMQWVGAPLVAMFAALGVAMWFRAGVERGIIITSPSELDRAVEREVGMIQKRGVASSTPKAVGALNQAFGSGGTEEPDGRRGAPAGTLSAVERAMEEAAELAAIANHPAPDMPRRRIPRGVADGDFRRPI